MNGNTNRCVLFEHDDVVAARGERDVRRSRPAGPAPTIATSRTTVRSVFSSPHFPCAQQADPEREQNQPQIERQRVTIHVDAIVAELLSPRNVARRVDLREPGEARPHRDAMLEAGHVFEARRARRRRSPRFRPAAARAGRRSSCRRAGCSRAAAARPSRSRACSRPMRVTRGSRAVAWIAPVTPRRRGASSGTSAR